MLNLRFVTNRSLAIAIAMCGSGLAALVAPPAMRFLIDAFDWRVAYQLMGLILAGGCAVMTLLFFHDDRPRRAETKSETAKRPARQMRALLLSPNFIKIGIASFIIMGANGAFMIHLSPALVDKGLSPAMAAEFAGIAGIGTIAGKLCIGWLFDRLGLTLVTIGVMLDFALASILLAMGGGQTGIVLLTCLAAGSAGGAILTLLTCLAPRFFPVEDFGLVFGVLMSIMGLTVAFSPSAVSWVHDQTGSYAPAFWVGVGAAAVSAVLLTTLQPVKSEKRASADPAEAY